MFSQNRAGGSAANFHAPPRSRTNLSSPGVDPGTGVIAAGGVRAVLEVAGVRDILTKSQGSANVLNVVQATFDALEQLKSPQEEAARRGKNAAELIPFWERRKQNA